MTKEGNTMPAESKKMSLMQLTFIVAVNMMGSGIIMLPANMAQVGAISLLSWIVTALGSMAIAYGFAQAGIFNQRAGGMSAYAEDAYGKDGYFQVFFLYFLSLAIGNVAIAASAVGYLAAFMPWLSATPVATCTGVIVLLWITTVANFGGPSLTGRIGAITVWGVILPVGFLSFLGWFWFSGTTFEEAWNPQGMSLGAGMGSSISLTLWAFLGMESAAQNSDAVDNPKRNVPLACMFGTLGAGVIYVLSTTVIQGIVPNAELAKSTGPFGLAFAKMFSPTVGSIVMALAVLACVGSLLGWQFTIAQTGKSAADQRMFPAFFSKVNGMGAPIVGMIVLGIVQSLLALSTISPSLSEQFKALVNLAVVTNVVPYVISLSALMIMMRDAKVPQGTYRLNVAVTVVAMLYSVYALYASGHEAVMGGMLVMGIGYIIWGFLAPRFATAKAAHLLLFAACAIALVVQAPRAQAQTPAGTTASAQERIKQSGRIKLGYYPDAHPFSFRDASGAAQGYSVALCERVAEAVKEEFGLSAIGIDWVAVAPSDAMQAIQQGQVDILCGSDRETLSGRKFADYSIPVFPGGIGAVVRADAPTRLREILLGQRSTNPNWRASSGQLVQAQTFVVARGSTAESVLQSRLNEFNLTAKIVPVSDYQSGIDMLLQGGASVFFGDRAVLREAVARSSAPSNLVEIDRFYTYEPVALMLARGDDALRLVVDRTLSRAYASGDFKTVYAKWFGDPSAAVLTFFKWNTLQE
jgi:putrescine:ornithine antiporter